MNGRLICVSGRCENLYPSDGGHIIVEKTDFAEGSSLMKVAVKKDGHRFFTHVNRVVEHSGPPSQTQDKTLPPKQDCREPEAEARKQVKQGSFSALLENKIQLSYSSYGPTGEHTVGPEENQCSSGTDLECPGRQTQSSQDSEVQSVLPSGPFNGLHLSVPNGLLVQFLREETEGGSPQERGILVKQSFQVLQDTPLSKELCRIVTGQGAVIRYMRDGSTEVLFADGSVSFSQDSGPVWVPDAEAENNKGRSSEKEAGRWQTTSPSGDRICTIGSTHQRLPTTPLLSFKATDPVTHQVMLTREDLVVLVQNPDGSLVVEHADGTRITSFLQDRTFTGEKPEGVGSGRFQSSVQRRDERGVPPVSERAVLVEKEGCASVVAYPERHMARVLFADGTAVTGTSGAEYEVFPSSIGVLKIQSDGKCTYSSEPPVAPNPSHQPGLYTMSHSDKVACDVTDDDGNHFQVMEDGQISVLSSSSASIRTHNNVEDKMSHCPRLFLVHEDGSGTELLSSDTAEELLARAYSDPNIAVLEEPLPDRQGELAITILKPGHRSVWSQWSLKKQNPDVTPFSLRNRPWKDFPAVEKKSPGPPFGSDTGVGLTLREGSSSSAAQHRRVQSCPEVLEMRELYQRRPFTAQLQNTVDSHP
ncbi:sperm-associated antigen 17, partial [Austrofundulus limnaeus]|uniref:Sperm-associated antigen 17 n=1 Tax=Austrofundulus limnaeus TaxID=52670 RepID=A0A2I4ALE7_AUSLI